MTKFGYALKALRMIRVYRDGSARGFVWRWWNPLVWALAPLVFIGCILVQGLPETVRYKHRIGFGMKPWFKERLEQLEWLP